MELSFELSVESNVTLFDDKVSAIADDNGQVKIIAKKDMLKREHGPDSFVSHLKVEKNDDVDVTYSLVDKFLDLNETIVEIELTIHELGRLGLLSLSYGGFISLSAPNQIESHLIFEGGEEDSTIEHDHDLTNGRAVIRMYMMSPSRFVVTLNDKELFWDLPKDIANVKVQGFLGRISGTDADIFSIKTYERSSLDRLLAESKPINAHVIQSTKKLEVAWTKELMDDFETYKGTKDEEALQDSANEALESYKNTMAEPQTQNTMGETILEMLMRLTGLSADQLTAFDHQTLLLHVYNGLNKDNSYEKMTHAELLKEAHALTSKLLVGEWITTDTKVSLGGKTYRTFEFGELNDDNCSPEQLLYLVRKYPNIWLDRIKGSI